MALNGLLNFGIFFNARTNIMRVAKEIATGSSQIERSLAIAERGRKAGASSYDKGRAEEFSAIGRGLREMGGPVAMTAGLVRSAKAAADFETSLTRAQLVMGDAGEDTASITRDFLRFSNETGIAATKVAKISEELGTKGLVGQFNLTNKELRDMTQSIAKFAVVTGQSTLVAAKNVGDLALQLRLFDEDRNIMPKFLSMMLKAGKMSASSASQIAEFVKALSPLRATTRISIEQLIALAGATRAFGGEVTKNLVKTQFPRFIDVAAQNLDKFGDAMGVSGDKVKEMINTDPFGFFLEFLRKMKGVAGNTVEFSEALSELEINSIRLRPIIAGATNQIGLLTNIHKEMIKERKEANELDQDFLKIQGTLNKQMERFGTILTNVKKIIGTPMLGVLSKFFGMLNNIGSVIVEIGQTAPAQFALFGITIGGVVSSFGLFRDILNKVARTLGLAGAGSLTSIMTGLGSKMAWMVAEGGTLAFILKAIGGAFERAFGKGLKRAADNFKLIFNALDGFIRDGFISMDLAKKLTAHGLMPIVLGIMEMKKQIDAFVAGFMSAFKGEGSVGDVFLDIVNTMFSWLRTFFQLEIAASDNGKTMHAWGKTLGEAVVETRKFVGGLIDDFLKFSKEAVPAAVRSLEGISKWMENNAVKVSALVGGLVLARGGSMKQAIAAGSLVGAGLKSGILSDAAGTLKDVFNQGSADVKTSPSRRVTPLLTPTEEASPGDMGAAVFRLLPEAMARFAAGERTGAVVPVLQELQMNGETVGRAVNKAAQASALRRGASGALENASRRFAGASFGARLGLTMLRAYTGF